MYLETDDILQGAGHKGDTTSKADAEATPNAIDDERGEPPIGVVSQSPSSHALEWSGVKQSVMLCDRTSDGTETDTCFRLSMSRV